MKKWTQPPSVCDHKWPASYVETSENIVRRPHGKETYYITGLMHPSCAQSLRTFIHIMHEAIVLVYYFIERLSSNGSTRVKKRKLSFGQEDNSPLNERSVTFLRMAHNRDQAFPVVRVFFIVFDTWIDNSPDEIIYCELCWIPALHASYTNC